MQAVAQRIANAVPYQKPTEQVVGVGPRGGKKVVKQHKHAEGDIVRLSNGAVAVVGRNGKLSFIKGANKGSNTGPRSPKRLSPRGAARAFNKYYKERSYKRSRSRKAAITRDMCHKKANMTSSRSYRSRSGPGRYDYPGLDDGSRCKSKGGVKASKPRSAKQRANDARLKGMSRAAIFKKQRGGRQQQKQQQQQQQWEQEWEQERRRQQRQQRRRQRQQQQGGYWY